jgi:Galactose oxidase, central domain
MGKKKPAASKAAAREAKKAKAAKKAEKTTKKKAAKTTKEDHVDEEDLVRTIEDFQSVMVLVSFLRRAEAEFDDGRTERWEAEHAVTEDIVDGPPSRRANASLTPCPVNNHLWLFGGEYFDGDKCFFYSDLYRYNPDKVRPPSPCRYSVVLTFTGEPERMAEIHLSHMARSAQRSPNRRLACWRWKTLAFWSVDQPYLIRRSDRAQLPLRQVVNSPR